MCFLSFVYSEEFNRKMITPDLREQDLENLYREAWDLYSVYFNPASPDHIPFSASVVEEMHSSNLIFLLI